MEASVININDIISFEEIEYETTYDITVEGNSNFYLATSLHPILVHNSGKSEFLDYISASLAVNENWRFAVFSFENQPTVLHDQKIAEKIVGKAFAFRKDSSHRITERELTIAVDTIEDRFKTIDKTKTDTSLDGILEKTEQLILRYGIRGLIIDPYNKILHKCSNMYDPSYINDFFNKITNFAVKWNIHLFLVMHPSKLQKDKGTGKIEKPTLYSISGGANPYNQMDNGLIIHRDRATGIVDVDIAKIRFNEQGKEGFVSFLFDTYTRQYKFHTSSNPIEDNKNNSTSENIQSPMFEDDSSEIPF